MKIESFILINTQLNNVVTPFKYEAFYQEMQALDIGVDVNEK